MTTQPCSTRQPELIPLWQLTARVPLTVVDAAVDLLEQYGFLGISWLECDDAPASTEIDDNGFPIASEFQIDAYTRDKPDLAFITGTLHSLTTLLDAADPIVTISLVDNTDWLSTCYQSLPARIAGDFYIYGSHITEAPPSNVIPVRVDAATAFGSGEHSTTIGCLTALSNVAATNTDALSITSALSILDMGCGSGILGIAAKKRWQQATVVSVDNDPESVRVAAQNALNNTVQLTVIESEGFANPSVATYAPYDIVLANILAKPVCALAPHFAANLRVGGIAILSGLLSRHHEEVAAAYDAAGFIAIDTYTIEDWMTLVFKKA